MTTPQKHLVNGKMITVLEGSKICNISPNALRNRIKYNNLSLQDSMFNYKNSREVLKGLSKTKEYEAWIGMKKRCNNPEYKQFSDYGGRGIIVSNEFSKSFTTFLNYIGKAPSKDHSLDRIEVNGNYERGNIKWSTKKEQNKNRRSSASLQIKINVLRDLLGLKNIIIKKVLVKGRTKVDPKLKREYNIWRCIKNRCFNENHDSYEYYGGRGIFMSIEFQESFQTFINHVGKCPNLKFSLDRIDNDKGYERGNLRWVDASTQMYNRRKVSDLEQKIEDLKKQCDAKNISYEEVI